MKLIGKVGLPFLFVVIITLVRTDTFMVQGDEIGGLSIIQEAPLCQMRAITDWGIGPDLVNWSWVLIGWHPLIWAPGRGRLRSGSRGRSRRRTRKGICCWQRRRGTRRRRRRTKSAAPQSEPGGVIEPTAERAVEVKDASEVSAGTRVEARAEPASAPAPKRGRPATIPTDHICCPHADCRGYGRFGDHADHRVVGGGTYPTKKGQQRQLFQCQWCQKRFSETQGTILFRLKADSEEVFKVLAALAEGNGIRATARIFGIKPDTVLAWLRRAGEHSQEVSAYLVRELQVAQVQLDELWTFVRKKEKALSAWEKLQTEYGDTWVWVAFDPVSKLVVSLVVGERRQAEADTLLGQVKERLEDNCSPLLTSDQLPHYAGAILRVFGQWVQPQRKGQRGPQPKPRPVAPPELQYATVNKKRRGRRIVAVTSKVVYGSLAAVKARLDIIAPAAKINTSYVERMNLTFRHLVSRLRRRGLTFSKKRAYLVYHLHLSTAYYHFVRPHGTLRQRLPEPIPTRGQGSPKKWEKRTPAMAAGLTDHIWSMEELMTFRVPPGVAL